MKHIFANDQYEILAGLRSGAVVQAKRGRGKTTAILQYAKELMSDSPVIVVLHRQDMRRSALHLWQELFGKERAPEFASSECDLRGLSGKILVDELAHSKYRGPFVAATL